MNLEEALKALVIALLEIPSKKVVIRKIGGHWYIMRRTWDRLYIREFQTHQLALTIALGMIEIPNLYDEVMG